MAHQPLILQQPGLPPQVIPLEYAEREPTKPAKGTTWTPIPRPIKGAPVGLEYLIDLDTIQMFQTPPNWSDWFPKPKYALCNFNLEQFYYAIQEDKCALVCCCYQKKFLMHFVDRFEKEILTLRCEIKAENGWLRGPQLECIVEHPTEGVLGRIVPILSWFGTDYNVLDARGREVFEIRGPGFCEGAWGKYKIFSCDGEFGSFGRKKRDELFRSRLFSLNFPVDLDPKMKAVLMAGFFQIIHTQNPGTKHIY